MDRKKAIENLLIVLLLLVIIFVFSKVYYIFKPFLDIMIMFIGPVIIGGFLYYWLRPVTRRLSKGKMHRFKGLITILVLLLFIIFIVVVVSSAGSVLAEQFTNMTDNLPEIGDNLIETIESLFNTVNLNLTGLNSYFDVIKDKLLNLSPKLPNMSNMVSGIGDFVTQITLIPFVVFYLLKEDDEIGANIKKHLLEDNKKEEYNLLVKIDSVLSTYIVGQLLVALIIGGLMFIGYLIIGMPDALLLATFSFITAVIPLVGAFLGIIPALILSLSYGLGMFIKVVIIAVIVQQLEGNFITPNLMGKRLQIHPFIVMIIVIVSINLLGIFGAFIGIPLYLSIMIIIKEGLKIRKQKKLNQE